MLNFWREFWRDHPELLVVAVMIAASCFGMGFGLMCDCGDDALGDVFENGLEPEQVLPAPAPDFEFAPRVRLTPHDDLRV